MPTTSTLPPSALLRCRRCRSERIDRESLPGSSRWFRFHCLDCDELSPWFDERRVAARRRREAAALARAAERRSLLEQEPPYWSR